MSIRPTHFHPDGSVDCYHDERGHGGTIPADRIQFAKRDGQDDFRFIILECPVPGCGSASVHPVGGGAAPMRVQELFVRALQRSPNHPSQTLEEAAVAAKALADAMDGPGRWQLSEVEDLSDKGATL